MFLFDSERLLTTADQRSASYRCAAPYPHTIIDDFLPNDVIDQVLAEFPGTTSDIWHQWYSANELKLESQNVRTLGPTTRCLLNEFNGAVFVEFLQRLTGIEEPLISDPFFEGGGLHQIERGGLLNLHADFNHHASYGLDRRINALLYLNRDWDEEFGGHLELWDTKMKACAQRILPIANRLVVFNTTSDAYHGHPDPLRCPSDRTRKSMALYYYSNGRPSDERAADHTTLWQQRPGRPRRATDTMRRLVPPIAVEAARSVRRRLAEARR